MRYCPLCVREDKDTYGETYWHRSHQIDGIDVCVKHKVFLEHTNIFYRNRDLYRHRFLTAEQAITDINEPRPLNLSDESDLIIDRIASLVQSLFVEYQYFSNCYSDQTIDRYRSIFIERDFASYSGRIRVEKLIISFMEKYPDQLLQRLRLEINPKEPHNWLLLFLRPSNGIQHPLKHLLLLDFLEIQPLNFFQLPENYRPFGEANWPCLNPVCPDYKQMIISDYHSKPYYCKKTKIVKPIGTFSCPVCQFTYQRVGPDVSLSDRFQFYLISFHGKIWDDNLVKLWDDLTITQKEIKKKLGLDWRTIEKHAARLNLSIPRDFRYKTRKKQNEILSAPLKKKSSTVNSEKLESYRTSFLEKLKENEGITRSQLKEIFYREYNWLSENDRPWLEANLPPSKKPYYTDSYKIYWQKRDLLIVSQIPDVVAKIKQISEPRPIRITLALIGRELGCKNTLQTQLSKLPKTKKLLDEVIETLEQFSIRRIWWAFDLFNQEKICPTKTQFLLKLNFRQDVKEKPLIQKNVSQALQLLEVYL
jgi:hypothetical protein